MRTRAQAATEYIVLVSVALIVMILAVSIFVVDPQLAYSAKKQRSDSYWANARPFAITSYAINQDHAILEVQNADPVRLSIKEIDIKGVSLNFSKISIPYNEGSVAVSMCGGAGCSMQIIPGQSALVVTDSLSISSVLQKLCFSGDTFQEGRYYEANLSIAYEDSSGTGEVQTSNVPLVGQCMKG